ncbi:MAG: hypothetical protein ACLR0N_16145 [Bilophila wadsworthia]
MVATMLLAAICFTANPAPHDDVPPHRRRCILGSGSAPSIGSDNNIMKALYRGLTVAALASAGLIS